jgi:ribosomal protein L32
MPIVTMGAAGAVCAALWLRYRAPARDCEALGPAGHPVVALPLAAALVMGGAAGETFLPPWGWLLWLAAFDVVVIIMLRRAIHVGLLEEALEIPIGPEIACPNCGGQTARHTFCGNCGISLQALPKTRPRRSEPVAMPASEPPA